MKNTFFLYTPFTGLGMYGGFRGNRWLRNRIKIFKQFVIPSLLNQSDRDFVHWISWRPQEENNPLVKELHSYLSSIPNYRFVFTYNGIAFWDDKLPDEEARQKLLLSLHMTLPALLDYAIGSDTISMLLVPSDDLYTKDAIKTMRRELTGGVQAVTYTKGYLCNYYTKELLEYNPKTNPPFFCINFPRETFFDSILHMKYTGPYKSHEYIGNALKLKKLEGRGFLVGTHGENISTHFNNPYGGAKISDETAKVLYNFGIADAPLLKLPKSFKKWALRRLPHKYQRKLRYIFGEKIFNRFYNFLRS